jgi:hypothetical protein
VVDIEHVKTYLLPSPVDFNDVPVQYLSLSPVNFDGVRPIQVMPDKCDAQDKCNAWLLMLQSNALDDSVTSRVSFGSPHSEAVHLHEYLVGVSTVHTTSWGGGGVLTRRFAAQRSISLSASLVENMGR